MGTIKQGILGGFSGGVGTVVGGSWKGIDYMRIRPARVANPQTDPQLDQRKKFAVTMKFLQPLSQFLRIGFKNFAVKMTAMNAAFAYNFRNALTGVYPNYAISYADALVSRGNLAPALNPEVSSIIAGTVEFSWTDNSTDINASNLDKTMLVVYNPAKNQAVCVVDEGMRSDSPQTVTLPNSFAGDLVQCYIGFISTDDFDLSNSTYAGSVTVFD